MPDHRPTRDRTSRPTVLEVSCSWLLRRRTSPGRWRQSGSRPPESAGPRIGAQRRRRHRHGRRRCRRRAPVRRLPARSRRRSRRSVNLAETLERTTVRPPPPIRYGPNSAPPSTPACPATSPTHRCANIRLRSGWRSARHLPAHRSAYAAVPARHRRLPYRLCRQVAPAGRSATRLVAHARHGRWPSVRKRLASQLIRLVPLRAANADRVPVGRGVEPAARPLTLTRTYDVYTVVA